MKLESRRFEYGNNYTVSRLSVDGVYQCYVLEDVVREPGVKVKEATAIPAGTYKVIINMSPSKKKLLPRLLDVPGFEGILIHAGNTDIDTFGCLLVGDTWNGGDFIGKSKIAFDKLFPKMEKALAEGDEITITIMDTK